MIWFYRKQFDSAQTALQKLMVDYPRGFYVNDALRLIMNLKQAGEDEAVLYDYSDAIYFTARRMPDSARARYRQLAGGPDAVLGDIALLRLARMDLVEADSSGAMVTLDTLLARYPESYYYPFGLKVKADILMTRSERREDAAILYRRLLEEFPNYPFASDVRESLRRYEQERVG